MPNHPFRPAHNYRWQDVDLLEYKDDGSAPFKEVTRQVLFEHPDLACQWRYFEVQPGGHSTLERHQHVHAVMILRGRGHCLVDREVFAINEHDLITVPTMTWHQFRAAADAPLGFLCLVNCDRDRPQLPTPAELAELRRVPEVATFIRV